MRKTALDVRATGYELKRLTCQVSGFAGVGNRSVAEEASINAQRHGNSVSLPS